MLFGTLVHFKLIEREYNHFEKVRVRRLSIVPTIDPFKLLLLDSSPRLGQNLVKMGIIDEPCLRHGRNLQGICLIIFVSKLYETNFKDQIW